MSASRTCPQCDGDLANGWCEPCDALRECCFPDCGCDGARLCMADSGASERASRQNVEGMWSGKTHEQRRAVMDLYGSVIAEDKGSDR